MRLQILGKDKIVPFLLMLWVILIYLFMEIYFSRQISKEREESLKNENIFVKESEVHLDIELKSLFYFSSRVDIYIQKRVYSADSSEIRQMISDYRLTSADAINSITVLVNNHTYTFNRKETNIKVTGYKGSPVKFSGREFRRRGSFLYYSRNINTGDKITGLIMVELNPDSLFKSINGFAKVHSVKYAIASGPDNSFLYGDYNLLISGKANIYKPFIPFDKWTIYYTTATKESEDVMKSVISWIIRLSALLIIVLIYIFGLNKKRLTESRHLSRLYTEYISDVLWVYNIDKGKFAYVSPGVLKHWGFTADEIKKGRYVDCIPEETINSIMDRVREKRSEFEADSSNKEFSEEIIQYDREGNPFWAEITFWMRRNKNGELEVVGNTHKINKSKERELQIERMNRELNTIAQCEKAILQGKTEREMLAEFAEILCNKLGYRFVWIGIPKQDKEKNIEPVAYAGEGKEYIDKAFISWSLTNPRGKGPSGRSVREGKPVFCNDIEKDATMKPWAEEAKLFGYKSSVALPLLDEAGTFGLITAYSDVVNKFDEKEISFLEKLAEELAFGIKYLRVKNDNFVSRKRLSEVQVLSDLFSWQFEVATGECTLFENCETIFRVKEERDAIFMDKSFLCHLSAKDSRLFTDAVERSLYNDSPETVEVLYKIDDKSSIWLRNKLVPLKNEDGQRSVFVISMDITQTRQMSGMLRKLSVAVDQSFASIVITDISGTIVYVNPRFSAITGYSEDEALGQNVSIIKSGQHDRSFYDSLWLTILSGKQWKGVFINRKKDGSIYYESAIISPITNEEGEIINFLAIKDDITDKFKIEREVKESEQRLRAIIDNTMTGIVIIDTDGTVLFTNPATEKIYGIPKNRIIGDNYSKFIYPADLKLAGNILAEVSSGYKNFSVEELRLINKNGGEPVWIQLSISKYPKNHDSEKDKILLIFQDITAHKNAEQQLRQSVMTRDKMFSIISHDLRGPIGNLLPLFEMYAKEDTDEIVKEELMREMKRMTATAYDLLENLLSWAKFQTKSIVLKPVDFNINDTISDVVSLYSSYANQKSITVTIETGTRNFVYADSDSVNLIIRNIFYNAIKFTPKYGKIAVKAHTKEGIVYITITDSGVGMSKDMADNIFNKDTFYTSYGTNNELGTGLGLQLCREFVTKNGGTIDVFSQIGKGTTFEFTLPEGQRVKGKGIKKLARVDKNDYALSGTRLLIVEDDKFNLMYIKSLMGRWQIIYEVASDGREALDKLEMGKYDLVLMDLEMPMLNGYSACSIIRKELKLDIPVIAMSANIDEEIIRKTEFAGFTDHISKPLNPKLLFVKMAYRLKVSIAGEDSLRNPGAEDGDDGHFVDMSRIISAFGEEEGIIRKMVEKFLEVSQEYISGIAGGFDAGNLQMVKSEAHKLKSNIGFFTTGEIADEVKQINDLAASGDKNNLAPLVEHFRKWFPSLCEELRIKYLK